MTCAGLTPTQKSTALPGAATRGQCYHNCSSSLGEATEAFCFLPKKSCFILRETNKQTEIGLINIRNIEELSSGLSRRSRDPHPSCFCSVLDLVVVTNRTVLHVLVDFLFISDAVSQDTCVNVVLEPSSLVQTPERLLKQPNDVLGSRRSCFLPRLCPVCTSSWVSSSEQLWLSPEGSSSLQMKSSSSSPSPPTRSQEASSDT